jgi:hypothetical protein
MAASGGLTLITVTGLRPEAFGLCKQYVLRQTWSGPLQWIIVDDGDPPMPVNPELFNQRGIEVTQIFPKPCWMPGQNTLARNLLAAIPKVKHGKVFFIEDDDWYAPDYLTAQAEHMGDALLVGEHPAIYYNIAHQLFAELKNNRHASMCQTGMQASALNALGEVCKFPTSIDIRLWDKFAPEQKVLYQGRRCIGIKGLPGRAGLGTGHRPQPMSSMWKYDSDWRALQSLVGEDHLHYKAVSMTQTEGDFEIFFWKGQKRYRCNQRWEGGGKCEFDTFHYPDLLAHISQPHTYSGKRAPSTPRRVVSPIVGPQGEEIAHEVDPEISGAKFRSE